MEKIVIIGCGGSGKSTLARELGDKLSIPVVHLDRLWWNPGWVSVEREEFDRLLDIELSKPYWIMDGNFERTMEVRLTACDTVIYLDYNRLVCLWGVVKRVIQYKGKNRPDMGDGCPERFNWEFLFWVWRYNKNKREKNYEILDKAAHVKKYIFKNRRQLKRFLSTLL